MAKRVALAGVIAAAIALAGLALSRFLFSGSEEQPASAPPDAARTAEPDPAGPPDAAAGEAQLPVEVVALEGRVERRAEDGSWAAIEAGAVLDPDDVVRTGPRGRASLDVGGVEVDLDSGSEISVPGITATVSRVVLGEGRVSARVPSGREAPFGVAVQGADAVAESADGEFAVLSDGEGRVTVAAIEGKARFTAGDETVEVEEGKQSVAEAGGAPSAPRETPTSLFLKVRRPGRKTRDRQVAVSGTTAPGAVLEVDGVVIEVDAEGRFATVIDLEEGENRIPIRSRDVLGREQGSSLEVDVDTRPPDVGGEVTWGDEGEGGE